MERKFSEKELLEIANSGLADLSCEQIKQLIKKECEKDNEHINTDFIDLCFDVLEMKKDNNTFIANSPEAKIRLKKNTLKKALVFAAVIMMFFATTLTVSAQLNLNMPQKIAQLINGNAEIDYNLENADTTADGCALLDTDLAKELADYGISPVTFPEEMIKENCKITEIEMVMNKDVLKIVNINFEYSGQRGNLYIQQISENTESAGVNEVMDVESGQMIKVNGMDILVFKQKDSCSIRYKDYFTIYDIKINCNLETAIKFAKSIK